MGWSFLCQNQKPNPEDDLDWFIVVLLLKLETAFNGFDDDEIVRKNFIMC